MREPRRAAQFIITGGVSGQGQSGQIVAAHHPGPADRHVLGPEFVGVNAPGQQVFNKYTVTRDAAGA